MKAAKPLNVLTLPLAAIRPSPTNPRKTIDPKKLEELAESIRKVGVIEPPVVRPAPGGGKGEAAYELAVGERRWRAAKLAGLTQITVHVRDLSDAQVLALQLIENDQREDVLPSEQAAAYKRLAAEVGVEAAAKEIGRPESTVRGLVRLAQLPPWALAAVDRGELPRATAELVARVPGEESRRKAAACVLLGEWDPDRVEACDLKLVEKAKSIEELAQGGNSAGVLTYRDTRALIAEHFTRELSKASFSRKALDLVPEAGTCDACPKRAGNVPELVAEKVRADVCTDPECYRAKTDAHAARLVEAAQVAGRPVLDTAEAKKAFRPDGGMSYDSPYYDLDAKCYAGEPGGPVYGKTFRKLLGKVAKEAIVVAVDPAGATRELLDRKEAAGLLAAHYQVKASANGPTSRVDSKCKADQAAARREDLVRKEAGRRAMAKAAATAEDVARLLFSAPGGEKSVELLRILVAGVVDATWADVSRQVVKRRGLDPDAKPKARGVGGVTRGPLAALVEGLGGAELLGVLAELVAGRRLFSWTYSGDKGDRDFWTYFGVDRKALEKEVRDEGKAKKAGQGKAAKGQAAAKTPAKPVRFLDPSSVPTVGSLALGKVDGMPPSAVSAMKKRAVVTLADLAQVIEESDPRGHGLAGQVYQALTHLGVGEGYIATAARDAILKHLGHEPAKLPAALEPSPIPAAGGFDFCALHAPAPANGAAKGKAKRKVVAK